LTFGAVVQIGFDAVHAQGLLDVQGRGEGDEGGEGEQQP
jgi:hypothetical protein